MAESSFIDPNRVKKLNDKVYELGSIDREHLLEFLTNLNTNDAETIITEVKTWLTILHNDPKYDKIRFADKDIEAVLGDLDSYGRLQPETIMQFKQASNRSLPLQ
jgi:hypothetical protein